MREINPPAIVQSLSRSIEQLSAKAATLYREWSKNSEELGKTLSELRDKCSAGEWYPTLEKLGIPKNTASELIRKFKGQDEENTVSSDGSGQSGSAETEKQREDISEPFVPEDERGDAWEPPAEPPSNPAAGRRGFSPSYARNPAYEESKRTNGKGAKPPTGPKAGTQLFAINRFEEPFGRLVRVIDELGNAYKCKESPEAKKLREALAAYKAAFVAWHSKISGEKK